MDHRVLALLFPFAFTPLSTDSCFLTKPALFFFSRADPVIMRLCPELQAARERCQQLRADLLNGLASTRSPKANAAPHCLEGERLVASGDCPYPILKLTWNGARGFAGTHMCVLMNVHTAVNVDMLTRQAEKHTFAWRWGELPVMYLRDRNNPHLQCIGE